MASFWGRSRFKKIKDLANNLLKKGNYSFTFHGYTQNQFLIDYLNSNYFDLMINTSSSEGIPVSMMEAQSFGIPIIATNVGGTSEIVNMSNGVLLNSNPTPKEIAQELMSFYNLDVNKKRSKRKASYETWKKYYQAKVNFDFFGKQLVNIDKKCMIFLHHFLMIYQSSSE